MTTRQRRPAAITLCGALLLGVVTSLAACSGGSAPSAGAATAGTATASTVIGPSSGSAAPGASTATTTAPAPGGSAGAASGSVTAPAETAGTASSPSAPSPRGTTSRPPAAGAANGRLVPSCRPAEFAQHAGVARGALQTYLFTPYAAGAMRASGTKGALALLHGGQAVRFSTQQLVAARGLLATCPRPVGGVVQAVDEQITALRALWPAFAANRLPASGSVAGVRSAQAATSAAAASARMPLLALVPTAVQIQTG